MASPTSRSSPGSFGMAGLALLVTGGFATGTMTLLNASMQETTPNEVRGRVMSFYTWLAAGMPVLGGWLLGTVMGIWTVQETLVTGGITLIVVTLIMGWEPGETCGVQKGRRCHEAIAVFSARGTLT